MKRKIAYFAIPLALIGLAVVCYLSFISPAAKADGELIASRLQGTWRLTVDVGRGETFQAQYSFASGGIMMETDEFQITSEDTFTTGQGVWARTGRNQYSYTWESWVFRTVGGNVELIAKLRVHGNITLTGRDTFTDVLQTDFFDPTGNLEASFCGTGQATRMTVEPVTLCPATTTSQTTITKQTSPVGNARAAKGWRRHH